MRTDIEERACDLALYIIEHRGTVRAAAKQFGISKSTVHKDLSQRLPTFNRTLYLQVKEILEQNKAERTSGAASPPGGNIKANKSRGIADAKNRTSPQSLLLGRWFDLMSSGICYFFCPNLAS